MEKMKDMIFLAKRSVTTSSLIMRNCSQCTIFFELDKLTHFGCTRIFTCLQERLILIFKHCTLILTSFGFKD